jgi:hypothetical protein
MKSNQNKLNYKANKLHLESLFNKEKYISYDDDGEKEFDEDIYKGQKSNAQDDLKYRNIKKSRLTSGHVETDDQIMAITYEEMSPKDAFVPHAENIASNADIQNNQCECEECLMNENGSQRSNNCHQYAYETLRQALLSSDTTINECVNLKEKNYLNGHDKFNSRKCLLNSKTYEICNNCISSSSSSGWTSCSSSSHSSGRNSPNQDLQIVSPFLACELSDSLQFGLNLNSFCSSTPNDRRFELKPITNMLKYDLNSTLNITRKDTLIYLIERNKSNQIMAPFDLFVYSRIKQNNKYYLNCFPGASSDSNNLNGQFSKSQENLKTKYDYNYSNIKKVNYLFKLIQNNPFDKTYLKQNNLLLNSVATFLMPFFFDIFKMAELRSFSSNSVEMISNLKQSYNTQMFLDQDSLTSHLTENVLWSCFVIYKYRLDDSFRTRLNYLNFYLSNIFQLIHLESIINFLNKQSKLENGQSINSTKVYIKKFIELNFALPHFMEALILTGLFKHGDYLRFLSFYYTKQITSPPESITFSNLTSKQNQTHQQLDSENCVNLKAKYLNSSMKSLTQKANEMFPLKLKNLCRIKLRESYPDMNAFESKNVSIPVSLKNFILYEDELEKLFTSSKNILIQQRN